MKQTQITKCPKCDTTFRVSPAQLEVAKGAVRCGACLHVFRASDHFQNAKKPEPVIQDDRTQDMFANRDESAGIQPKVAPKKEKGSLDDMADNELIQDSPDDFHFSEAYDEKPQQGDAADEYDLSQPINDEDDDFLIDDNNGLDDDLIDDGNDRKTPVIDINEDFLSINTEDNADPFYTESDKLMDTVKADDSEDDDESWADALLDDSQDTSKEDEQAKKKNLKPAPSKPNFSFIEEDPLDLSLPQKASRKRLWIYGSCAAVLLIALVGQMAFFNFDQWSRDEQYRPYYTIACEHIGCVLPSTYDVRQIRTTASPQVTSHPSFKNALSVDVLFMNHASYEQAFPKLELTFTDSNDKVVAHRLFSPREYLAGEASGLTMMPVETPIHIALEIQDPGPKANNYQVRFLAP